MSHLTRSQPPGVGPSLLQKAYSLPLQQLSGPKEASSQAAFHSICGELGDDMDEGIDKFEAGWGLITGE